jgi:glycosyltransferase involved in cell wall biosynthesis
MNIWLINNYVTLPQHGHFCRQYYFGKCLKDMGHNPVVFAGSHPHNSDVQLIKDHVKYDIYQETPFPWILVKTLKYGSNRIKQVFTMFQFYCNGKKAANCAAKRYGKPDAILGSSAHPLAALLAVRLAKKYGCRSVVEVRDLWPETIVAFGIAGPRNPAVLALRRLEKWLYIHADTVVFTMEGAYDYIQEQGWEKDIPKSKVCSINNGVDIEAFDYNRTHFHIKDSDLENPNIIKVVYTGSIRLINKLGLLVDMAKELRNPRIKLLIWGAGNELDFLRKRVEDEAIPNIIFKGFIEKKYIPYIVSQADINLVHWTMSPMLKYGISYNKLFEYLAGGHPIYSTIRTPHSIIEPAGCGFATKGFSPKELAEGLEHMAALSEEERQRMGKNARKLAEEYDFSNLTKKLIKVMES